MLGGYASRDRSGWMWDLTIPGDHDFYIQTVATAILVHNNTPCDGVAARARELQSQLPEAQQGRVTMAVGIGRDAGGNLRTVVGTSEPDGYLRAGVTLKAGEELARGSGDAEVNILEHMDAPFDPITPIAIAAGRPICPDCAEAIQRAGAIAASELRQ